MFSEVKNVNVESLKNGSKMLFFSIARRRGADGEPIGERLLGTGFIPRAS